MYYVHKQFSSISLQNNQKHAANQNRASYGKGSEQ